jgi:hypothetical protein
MASGMAYAAFNPDDDRRRFYYRNLGDSSLVVLSRPGSRGAQANTQRIYLSPSLDRAKTICRRRRGGAAGLKIVNSLFLLRYFFLI